MRENQFVSARPSVGLVAVSGLSDVSLSDNGADYGNMVQMWKIHRLSVGTPNSISLMFSAVCWRFSETL